MSLIVSSSSSVNSPARLLRSTCRGERAERETREAYAAEMQRACNEEMRQPRASPRIGCVQSSDRIRTHSAVNARISASIARWIIAAAGRISTEYRMRMGADVGAGACLGAYLRLLADEVRESTSDTADLAECVHHLARAVDVRVEHTEQALEVGILNDERLLAGDGRAASEAAAGAAR
jgi:hypothetical protein